jgi:hypothetical protein
MGSGSHRLERLRVRGDGGDPPPRIDLEQRAGSRRLDEAETEQRQRRADEQSQERRAAGALARTADLDEPLLRAIGLFVLVWVALTTTTLLIPFAIWLAIRWCLLAPTVELGERSGRDALRRSRELTRGGWWRTASLVGLSAAISLGAGPLLGAMLIFVVDAPLATLNIVAGIVYAAALPFVGLVTAYAYFDARTRVELEPVVEQGDLPPEIELA